MSMLPASTVRNLGQKEYEKRKQAALEVENIVRSLCHSLPANCLEAQAAVLCAHRCASSEKRGRATRSRS